MQRLSRRRAVLLALALGAVVALPAWLLLFRGGGSEPTGPVTVRVDVEHPGRAIPPDFLGLSIEYTSVFADLGAPGRPDRAWIGLAGALGTAQGSPVGLRVGGNSGDESWWDPGGRRARPPGVLNALGPGFARSLAQGQSALGSPLALGLDLAHGDPGNALALVSAVGSAGLAPPGLTTLEIGNEPDLFSAARTFTVGPLRITRPQQRTAYDPAVYVREAGAFAGRIAAAEPTRLSAGAFASSGWVGAAIPPLLQADPGRFGELTAHTYGLGDCNGDESAASRRDDLLSDGASRGLASRLTPYLATGLPVRVGELNSVVCGGVAGVSDTLAAALWAPDALFALAAAGATQADVHTWHGSLYAPWVLDHGAASVRPLFYGLLLFARAAPTGSQLVPVRLDGAGSGVRAWATRAGGTVRVLLINRSGAHRREIRLHAPPGLARIEYLRGPGLAATSGVTLDGAEVPDGSRTGALVGPRGLATLSGPRTFVLPPASAALVEIEP